jgi:hypothetical protein
MPAQKRSIKSYGSLLIGLFIFCLGSVLRGGPSDPDLEFTKPQELGLFLLFVWFSISTVDWGRAILLGLGINNLGMGMTLATGSAWIAFLGLVLGHLGLIGYDYFPMVLLLLFTGSILAGWLNAQSNTNKKNDLSFRQTLKNPADIILLGIVSVVFISLLVNASLAHGTSDPFLYHLLGPRLWVDRGEIYFPTVFPATLQSTTWEMLNVISQNLLGGPQGLGMIEEHIFSQYLHVAFGVGGCFLILFSIATYAGINRIWIWPALLTTLLSPAMYYVAWLGKNDWGVLFWMLSGTFLLLQTAEITRARLALAGVLLGFGLVGKPNSAFFVAPLLCFFSVEILRKNPIGKALRTLSLLATSIALSMLPILIRNWSYTDCPLYPFIDSMINPNVLSLIELQYKNTHPPLWHFSWTYAWKQMQWIYRDSASQVCILFCLAFALTFKSSALRKLAWLTPIGSLWLLSAQVENAFVRWLGAPLILSGFIAVLGTSEVINRIQFLARQKYLQIGCSVALTLFLASKVIVHNFWKLPFNPSPSYVIRTPRVHFGGDSKAWLRMNGSFETPIFSTGDNQLYYISHLPFSAIGDDPRVSRIVSNFRTPDLLVKKLYELGFRYALDVNYWNRRYWTIQAAMIDYAASNFPESIVYQGKDSEVIDIKVLHEAIVQACAVPVSVI